MILERITALGTDGSRVMLWFDDGTKMKTAARVVADRGLYPGMVLDEDALGALTDSVKKSSARDRAVRIVSSTAISERELRRRLVRKGERREDADAAVDFLKDLGAVDDREMAKRIVRRCLDKGYGERRIRQTLYQKGIPRNLWDDAMGDLPDMGPAIRAFLDRQLAGKAADKKQLDRCIAALQRRGHSWEDIRSALRAYTDALEDWE